MNIDRSLRVLPLLAALSVAAPAYAADSPDSGTARGKYLVTIMDCSGCHTDGSLAGQPDARRYLAGSSIGFGGPDGIVYPPNLTPHEENGLGRWSEEQIALAIRAGRRPDGRILAPVMPWPSYASLTDADVRAIVAYLRSLPPNAFRTPAPVAAGGAAQAPYLELRTVEAIAGR